MMKQTLNPPSPCPPVGRTRPVARTGSAVASAQRPTLNGAVNWALSVDCRCWPALAAFALLRKSGISLGFGIWGFLLRIRQTRPLGVKNQRARGAKEISFPGNLRDGDGSGRGGLG